MGADVLRLDSVVKSYGGFRAVDGLSFSVREGEIFGFLGPNGAGKTTSLRMVLDIIAPTSGAIHVLGAQSAGPVRRRIGYLPEERGLYRKMRAAETIAYFARLRGVPRREAWSRAMALLEEFGLAAFARSRNEALSKGMAQKVQLLATIAHDPDLLILDEPFSGLDPLNQATLEGLVRDMQARGKTIVFSTHVMAHAERLCDRFLILAKGKSRFEGNLGEARALFPKTIRLHTNGDAADLERLPGVLRVRPLNAAGSGGELEALLEIAESAAPQDVLKAAVAAGLAISHFDAANASLHEIFMALAGDDVPAGSIQGGEAAA